MKKSRKTKISEAQNYEEIGSFWDVHDLADYWDKTNPVTFEVDVQSHVTYYAVDNELAASMQKIAKQRGISAHALLNLWIQEKVKSHRKKPTLFPSEVSEKAAPFKSPSGTKAQRHKGTK